MNKISFVYIIITFFLVDFGYSIFLSANLCYILLLFSCLGGGGVFLFVPPKYIKDCLCILLFSFYVYYLYQLLCHSYRLENGLPYIFSKDGYETYLPYTFRLLDIPYFDIPQEISLFSSLSFVGYILMYFVPCVQLSSFLNIDAHLMLQISLSFITAIFSLVLYFFLAFFNETKKNALRICCIYALVSPMFYLSGLIVRDMPINLCIGIIIYLSLNKFSMKNLLIMSFLCYIISLIRLSSAYFMLLFVFFYVFVGLLMDNRYTLCAFFICVSLYVFNALRGSIVSLLIEKQTHFSMLEDVAESNRLSSLLNKLPFGVSHIVKTIVCQIWPTPCWTNMSNIGNIESYNIMRFPDVFSKTFSFFLISVILIRSFSTSGKQIMKKYKMLTIDLLLSILFLCLQSNTMEDRRKMGCYPVFLVFAVMLYLDWPIEERRKKMPIIALAFAMFQIFGLFISR